MSIAILGWGSLIWDLRDLPIIAPWQHGGPVLSIEFSRISRDGRLTLVIDELHGVDTPTRYALSARTDLEQAITDLQNREGAPARDRIGFVDRSNGRVNRYSAERHQRAVERIRSWCDWKGFEAVIWTALGPRFHDAGQPPFSPDAALRYVMNLPQGLKEKAFEYIRRAPEEVMTPFRRLFRQAVEAPATSLRSQRRDE